MEVQVGEEEAMSPSAQYLHSSALSLTILGVMEFEAPIDDSMTMPLLKDLFMPINPRFSSIMIRGEKGKRKWKKVAVNLKEHVNVPIVPSGMPMDYYDDCFSDYLSTIATQQLPQNRPLWEIHILKYPTTDAAGTIIFKLHHSLGDGYSLMGALLTCLRRADDPSLPLSFPSKAATGARRRRRLPRFFTGLAHTAYDFVRSLCKTSFFKDDKSPIRSGADGVEFRPVLTFTMTFSVDQLKQIKSKLNVTINDVVTGIITLGTRLYMQKTNEESGESNTTVLVLLNTRVMGGGYKSVEEMIRPDSESPWGNRFAFLQVSVPKLRRSGSGSESEVDVDPLVFVSKAHRMIKRRKNSAAVYLTGHLLSLITKIRGHEATAKYIHATLKNTSMAISNMIGPVEKMALANQPCKGLYFVVAGPPQSLSITVMSYVGQLRVAVNVEKGFIDHNKLKSCIQHSFNLIYKAALGTSSSI